MAEMTRREYTEQLVVWFQQEHPAYRMNRIREYRDYLAQMSNKELDTHFTLWAKSRREQREERLPVARRGGKRGRVTPSKLVPPSPRPLGLEGNKTTARQAYSRIMKLSIKERLKMKDLLATLRQQIADDEDITLAQVRKELG